MDGSRFGDQMPDIFETNATKNPIVPPTMPVTDTNGGEATRIEQNAASHVVPAQPIDDAAKKNEVEATRQTEEAQLADIRQQLHTKTYFTPTFVTKPQQIGQEREQRYQAEQQQEDQEKKQEEVIQKQQSDDLLARQQRARKEGEGSKIGG